DIGQAVVHGRRDTVGVLLIVTVWVKATGVVTHAKVQRTISLRMPLRRLAVRYKPTQGRTNQGSASGREERSATQYGGLSMSVHASPPRMCRLRALTPSVHKQHYPGKRAPMLYVPVQDIGCRAGVAGVDSARISGYRAVRLEAVQAQ